MNSFNKGAVTGALVTLSVIAMAAAVAYARKAEIAMWLLQREAAAIRRDPLGRLYSYIRPEPGEAP